MQRIGLVEDEKSLSDMIKLNLEMDGFQVLVYDNGQTALNDISELTAMDLLILDVMLPQISGLEICRSVRERSQIPILFLSAKGTTSDRIAGLKLGANDYLPKPFELEELLLKVQVLTKKNPADLPKQKEMRVGTKTVSFRTYEITDDSDAIALVLSKKEIELLRLFSEKEGVVVSRDEILDKIWGDQFPTSRTIDNYILSFRKIFEKDPKNPIYFHSIRGVGYKFTPGAAKFNS
jgi:two-component system, OmpR family, alkaline phosphatase synthesis response regulator PhoP